MQLVARAESPALVAQGNDRLRQRRSDPGDVGEERRRRGVHLDPDAIDAAGHDLVEARLEPRLVHVVLILSHADGLGIDLHQLGERILQPTGDRDGAAERDIEPGKLGARLVGGGVDRRAGFVDHDDLWARRVQFAERGLHQRLRFAARRPVADRDQVGGEACHQRANGAGEAILLVQVERVGVDECAGGGDDGHFHPRAEARIEPDDAPFAGGRGKEELFEIAPENGDRVVVGA